MGYSGHSFTPAKLLAWSVFVVVALVSSYRQIGPFEQIGNRVIGHGDEAHVAMVARNFAEGKGMTADTVWLLHNGGQVGDEVSHPEGYWSIYMAAFLAVFFKMFGANRVAVLLAASLIKVGIAALGFHWIRRLTDEYFAATAGGVFLLVHPIMADRVSGLSDIYLTGCFLAAITALMWATEDERLRWYFLGGCWVGLAIGIKPTGLMLLGLIPVWLLVGGGRFPSRKQAGLCLLGLTLAVTPLAIHNYNAGGSIWWPDLPLMRSTSRAMIASIEVWQGWTPEVRTAWNSAAFDPTSTSVNFPFGSRDWIRLHAQTLFGFFRATLRGEIAPVWLFPFVFHLIVTQWCAYWKPPVGYKSQLNQFVMATLLLSGAGLVLAASVYPHPRYWNYLVPFLAITGIVGATKLSRACLAFILIWCVIWGSYYHYQNVPRIVVTNVAEYRVLDALLPKDAVVMTSNPWEFSFHTHRRSVVLPYSDRPKVVTDLADRYSVDYLVVIRNDARHPSFDPLEAGVFPPYLEKLLYSKDLIVGKFR